MRKAKWRKNLKTAISEALTGMTEPYTIEDLYPVREVETFEGSGEYKEIRAVMPHQARFHDAIPPSERNKAARYNGYKPKRATRILFNGGVGAGKSISCCADILLHLRRYPGIIIYNVIPIDWMYDEIWIPRFREVLPDDSPLIRRLNVKTRTYYMKNGSQLHLKAFDEASKIKGFQAHRIYIEEASEIGDTNNSKAKEIFAALMERLRAPGRQYNAARAIIANQNPKGHNWSWEKWIKPNKHGDRGQVFKVEPNEFYPDGFEFAEYEHTDRLGFIWYCISAGSVSNPFNPPDYVAGMTMNRVGDPGMLARMVGGHFNPITSLVYGPEYFSLATHLIQIESVLNYWGIPHSHLLPHEKRDAIPRDWPLLIGIDSAGLASPWAVEFYVETPEDDLGRTHYICIDEIYGVGWKWHEIADIIGERVEGWNSVQYWIDPFHSMQKSGPNGECIYDEFHRLGLPVQKPRGYNKPGAVLRVRSFLHRDRRHPCPYLPDDRIEDPASPYSGQFEIGAARLYYAGYETESGTIAYADKNLKEKEVYRFDTRRQRAEKEEMEGLSPLQPEKIVDRDDHAQTAEMFAFLGISPLPTGVRKGKIKGDPVLAMPTRMRNRL